jgi:transposase
MIRIDAIWLAVEPVDMRAGADRLLARVVQVFGAAQAHHGYLFANARSTRIKLLVHDGFGVWCAARRLNVGSIEWPRGATGDASATPRSPRSCRFQRRLRTVARSSAVKKRSICRPVFGPFIGGYPGFFKKS